MKRRRDEQDKEEEEEEEERLVQRGGGDRVQVPSPPVGRLLLGARAKRGGGKRTTMISFLFLLF